MVLKGTIYDLILTVLPVILIKMREMVLKENQEPTPFTMQMLYQTKMAVLCRGMT